MTQSFSLLIRDGLFDVVSTDPFFADYTCRRNKMLRVQTELLPYLGVYLGQEDHASDGDANAGMIRFSETAHIYFSVMVADNDQQSAEAMADAGVREIRQRLWADQHIMNVLHSSLPDNTVIESLPRASVRTVYGNPGLNNETPVVEKQYDVSVFYRTDWPPIITDTLDEIDVTTGIKAGDTPEEMAQRQQVAAVYKFDTSRRARAPLAKPWLRARDQNRSSDNG